MNFKIKKQTKNILLKREEFLIEIDSKKNPKKEEVLAFLKKDPESSIVKTIKGNFGRNVFELTIFVYEDIKAKEQIEHLPKKIKKKLEEERKKEDERRIKNEEEQKAKKLREVQKEEGKNGN